MGTRPLWYTQVQFNPARPIPLVRIARDIPDGPGCYVFTEDAGPLVPGQVLYVGRARNLRRRVGGYLVDYMAATRPTTHKGRAFIFHHREQKQDRNVFLRWTVYGDPVQLEASLIDLLDPQYNDRFESNPYADDEWLDPRFMP
jgi:excinuclease UvrABC nuclease subunit